MVITAAYGHYYIIIPTSGHVIIRIIRLRLRKSLRFSYALSMIRSLICLHHRWFSFWFLRWCYFYFLSFFFRSFFDYDIRFSMSFLDCLFFAFSFFLRYSSLLSFRYSLISFFFFLFLHHFYIRHIIYYFAFFIYIITDVISRFRHNIIIHIY